LLGSEKTGLEEGMDPSRPVEELRRRRERVLAMGGPERVARQHAQGKLTARERLALLLDPDTFVELDAFVTHRATAFGLDQMEIPADAVVTGYGRVDGRTVYVFAQDFTSLGGTLGEMHARKIAKVQSLALRTGCPIVGLYDSGGARIQEGVAGLNGFGEIFRLNVQSSGVIPQISVILGPCAGGAVYSPALTDVVIMAEGTSQMFITGPQVIRTVTGEEVTFEALGGARVHATRSGVAHLTAPGEKEALALVRRVLSYLPDNNLADPPEGQAAPPDPNYAARLDEVVPTDPAKPYDVRHVLWGLLDEGSFLELQPHFATNAVIGLARLAGHSVAVVANQPRVLAGCLDIDASDKIARFVRWADAFHLPLLTFVDTPGYLPGVAQEHGGIIRHGAKVLYAYSEATVPKVTVILRKAYGGAYLAMCSRSLGADQVLAFPTAEIAVMGPEGAAEIIFRQAIQSAPDPDKARQAHIAAYRRQFAHPYVAASLGLVDMVVEPHEARGVLTAALAALAGKRESGVARKHGNLPL
jgi:acetyl-CoA carboxylase carboxyltransferase component